MAKKVDIAQRMRHYRQHGKSAYSRSRSQGQKGRESLNIPKSKTGKNEGNTMMEGKNENGRD